MQKWPDFYNRNTPLALVQIRTSDPTASNSGTIFVGLIANTLNSDRVVDENALHQIMPQLVSWFNERGLMRGGTTEMRERFVTLGMVVFPIVAAYESNLFENCFPSDSEPPPKISVQKRAHAVSIPLRLVVTSYARLERRRSAAH